MATTAPDSVLQQVDGLLPLSVYRDPHIHGEPGRVSARWHWATPGGRWRAEVWPLHSPTAEGLPTWVLTIVGQTPRGESTLDVPIDDATLTALRPLMLAIGALPRDLCEVAV